MKTGGEGMAFGIAANSRAADVKAVRGRQKEIACECWFTSKGKIMPLMIKLEDEYGEIIASKSITVHSQEKKRYAGLPSVEYDCTLEIGERSMRAWLIYYMTEGRWVLNFRA